MHLWCGPVRDQPRRRRLELCDAAQVITVAEIENNYFLIVSVACNNCAKEHLLFDNDLHGWNGFVCGGDSKDEPRPEARVWKCACGAADHAVTVSIQSQGQSDFQQ